MALQDLGFYIPIVPWAPGITPGGAVNSAIGSDGFTTFNGAGDAFAIIFQSPGTTVPDQISFNVLTVAVAGSAGDIEATLENGSASE